LLDLLFSPEDQCITFLWSIDKLYETTLCHISGGNTLQYVTYILVTQMNNRKKKCAFCNADCIIGWWQHVNVSEILTISIFKAKWWPTGNSRDIWNVGNTTYFYTASSPTNKSTLAMKYYKISKSSVFYVISECIYLNQNKNFKLDCSWH
jgi:hypothetical protein